MAEFSEEIMAKPIPVVFRGMANNGGSNNDLTINLKELHHLLEIGDVEVVGKRIRPCLIQDLATMYDTHQHTPTGEEGSNA